jgi:hypothetical protein
MKSYFDARIVTLCGIPSITLLGTADDWRAIRRRAEVLSEFDLGSWIAALLPVLDQFVAAADGHADRSFWRSIYKIDSQSGGPYISGWINVLFPYLDYGHYPGFDGVPQPNRSITAWQPPAEAGVPTFPTSPDFPTLTTFPRGMSFAPFTWNYLGTDHLMMFCGGFCGVSQDARTNAVRPVIGWAIQHLPH